MSGSNVEPSLGGGYAGSYGTLGVPSASNMPGSRGSSSSSTDNSGNLWLFGGYGYDAAGNVGILNDLWMYSPVTDEWTWMGGSSTIPTAYSGQPGVFGTLGVPAGANHPGGHWGATSWTDSAGHFWLFGGEAVDVNGEVTELNDLWEYDPSTSEWTWMAGSETGGVNGFISGSYGTSGVPDQSNFPGSRGGAAGWSDSGGHLWLFGGWGWDSNGTNGLLNDLWKFDPSTKEWTWVNGSSTIQSLGAGQNGEPGNYGAIGVAAPTNEPGGREFTAPWTDPAGNFWLFGGEGYDSAWKFGYLNDLWEFSPSSSEWVWRGGTSTLTLTSNYYAEPGIYGTEGVASAGNIAGSRSGAVTWVDSTRKLWLFGGYGFDAQGQNGWMNDIWQFDPVAVQWTWMGGASTLPTGSTGATGVYGTLGVPAAANVPDGRSPAVGWSDSCGNLWLFGGRDFHANSAAGDLNDLW